MCDEMVIAHNAGFDRKMVERRFPRAVDCRWACSFKGIDWQAEGIASVKLDYLAYRFGFFFEGHRAVNDAEATLHLLSMTLPVSQQPAMQALLASARKPVVRLLASFDYNKQVVPTLKARSYVWFPDKKLWHKLVPESERDTESKWLAHALRNVKNSQVTAVPLTAKDMYSIREMM